MLPAPVVATAIPANSLLEGGVPSSRFSGLQRLPAPSSTREGQKHDVRRWQKGRISFFWSLSCKSATGILHQRSMDNLCRHLAPANSSSLVCHCRSCAVGGCMGYGYKNHLSQLPMNCQSNVSKLSDRYIRIFLLTSSYMINLVLTILRGRWRIHCW